MGTERMTPEQYRAKWRREALDAVEDAVEAGELPIPAAQRIHRRFHRAASVEELTRAGEQTRAYRKKVQQVCMEVVDGVRAGEDIHALAERVYAGNKALTMAQLLAGGRYARKHVRHRQSPIEAMCDPHASIVAPDGSVGGIDPTAHSFWRNSGG